MLEHSGGGSIINITSLIEALAGDFEPDKYKDPYREQLMALIEKKAAGEEIVAEPVVEEQGKVVDLMAALEARPRPCRSRRRRGRGRAAARGGEGRKAAKKRARARKSA